MTAALMTKEELIEAAYEITGGSVPSLSSDKIVRLMTITQFISDLCLNEIEARGEIEFQDGFPVIPYCSGHAVETLLTREEP